MCRHAFLRDGDEKGPSHVTSLLDWGIVGLPRILRLILFSASGGPFVPCHRDRNAECGQPCWLGTRSLRRNERPTGIPDLAVRLCSCPLCKATGDETCRNARQGLLFSPTSALPLHCHPPPRILTSSIIKLPRRAPVHNVSQQNSHAQQRPQDSVSCCRPTTLLNRPCLTDLIPPKATWLRNMAIVPR